jgi:hypothetical protein
MKMLAKVAGSEVKPQSKLSVVTILVINIYHPGYEI